MAGHSKWSNIKRKKGANDSKKSKLFSKLAKEIAIACRNGSTDPALNMRLRLAIQNAKGMNMPKEAITRAINKNNIADEEYQEVMYEGYASHGVAVIIVCVTNKITRTVSNIRSILTKYGGSLEKGGSVSFLFSHKGCFTVNMADVQGLDQITLLLIDAGAEEIENDHDSIYITCPVEAFGHIQKQLEKLAITPIYAGLQYLPNTRVELEGEKAEKIIRLIDALEEDDDVQRVYHNLADTSEDIQSRLG